MKEETKIIWATLVSNENVITLHSEQGEFFEFYMSTLKTLPQWAEKEFSKMRFIERIGDCMFFVRKDISK